MKSVVFTAVVLKEPKLSAGGSRRPSVRQWIIQTAVLSVCRADNTERRADGARHSADGVRRCWRHYNVSNNYCI